MQWSVFGLGFLLATPIFQMGQTRPPGFPDSPVFRKGKSQFGQLPIIRITGQVQSQLLYLSGKRVNQDLARIVGIAAQ
jgi:hypothetical protein